MVYLFFWNAAIFLTIREYLSSLYVYETLSWGTRYSLTPVTIAILYPPLNWRCWYPYLGACAANSEDTVDFSHTVHILWALAEVNKFPCLQLLIQLLTTSLSFPRGYHRSTSKLCSISGPISRTNTQSLSCFLIHKFTLTPWLPPLLKFGSKGRSLQTIPCTLFLNTHPCSK